MTLTADERKLRQVVFNLLSNAVKFTPAGGSVDDPRASGRRISSRWPSATPAQGSSPADRELIFEEFRQGRDGSLARHEGTGLGLPLSRRFVELHGGRLWVESSVGAGSTFRFTLPLGSSW